MIEHGIDKIERQPLVQDATYIDPTTDDSAGPPAEGAVAVVAGTPADGDVPTFVSANNRLEFQAPGAGTGVSDGDKGDITVSSSGTVFTIDTGAVTLAKIANIATARLLGRSTAGSGVPEEITIGTGLLLSGGALSAPGGAGTAGYSYDTPEGSPSALDDNFDSATLDAKYTSINTGANYTRDVHTTKPGAYVATIAGASTTFRGILDAFPSGDGCYQVAYRFVTRHGDNKYVALVAANGNTAGAGSQHVFGLVSISGRWQIYSQKWTNFTTFSASGAISGEVWEDAFIILRQRRVGTTWFCGWSPDGRIWHEVSITEATLGYTPTYIGPMQQNNTATGLVVAIDHVRYHATPTHLFGG